MHFALTRIRFLIRILPHLFDADVYTVLADSVLTYENSHLDSMITNFLNRIEYSKLLM